MARWYKLQLPPPAQFPTKFTTFLTLILRLFLAPSPEKILIKTESILGYLSPPISAAWKEVMFLRSGTQHRVTTLCLSFFWHLVGEDWESGHVALKFLYFVPSPHACPVLKPGLLPDCSVSCSSRPRAMNTSTLFLSLPLLKTGPTLALSTPLICYQQPGLATPILQMVR